MATERSQGHHRKNRDELEQYQETVIREQGPTNEVSLGDVEATDALQPSRSTPSRFEPTARHFKFLDWFREEWAKAILVTIVVVLLSWAAGTLFSLNREVGELDQRIENVDARIRGVNNEIERAEERLRSEMRELVSDVRRLENRLDRER